MTSSKERTVSETAAFNDHNTNKSILHTLLTHTQLTHTLLTHTQLTHYWLTHYWLTHYWLTHYWLYTLLTLHTTDSTHYWLTHYWLYTLLYTLLTLHYSTHYSTHYWLYTLLYTLDLFLTFMFHHLRLCHTVHSACWTPPPLPPLCFSFLLHTFSCKPSPHSPQKLPAKFSSLLSSLVWVSGHVPPPVLRCAALVFTFTLVNPLMGDRQPPTAFVLLLRPRRDICARVHHRSARGSTRSNSTSMQSPHR